MKVSQRLLAKTLLYRFQTRDEDGLAHKDVFRQFVRKRKIEVYTAPHRENPDVAFVQPRGKFGRQDGRDQTDLRSQSPSFRQALQRLPSRPDPHNPQLRSRHLTVHHAKRCNYDVTTVAQPQVSVVYHQQVTRTPHTIVRDYT